MKKAALLLTFLLGAVSAFYWAASGSDGDLLDGTVDPLAGAPSSASDPVENLVGSGADNGTSGESLREESEIGDARSVVAGAQGQAGKPLVVQVFAGKVGVPAGGAEVFFVDLAELNRAAESRGSKVENPRRGFRLGGDGGGLLNFSRGGWRGRGSSRGMALARQIGQGQHWSEAAVLHGHKYTADEDGRVTLPSVAEWAVVAARRPGEYGFLSVQSRHKPVENLVLGRDDTLTIRVADASGRGVAGVPVAVQQSVPVQPRRSRVLRDLTANRERLRVLQAQLTSAQSRPEDRQRMMVDLARFEARVAEAAAVANAEPEIRLEPRVRRTSDSDGMVVVKHFQLFRRNPEKWWQAKHQNRFRAALLIPVLHPVAATFDGVTVPAEPVKLTMPQTGSVVVRILDHAGRPFVHPANADLRVQGDKVPDWTRIPSRKEQEASFIEFPFVGLGLQVRPHVWLDDRDFTWDGAVEPGPQRDGERVVLDVKAPATFGILRGRLVDGEGAPLPSISPTFLIDAKAGRVERETIATDAAGRFQLMFKLERQEPQFSLEVRLKDVHPPIGMLMRLPTLANGKTVDLGDLELAPLRGIVAGVILNDARQPIAGAEVNLQRERPVGGKTPRNEWHNAEFLTARTDAEGRYELFGDPLPGRFRVRAEARNHFRVESPDILLGSTVDLTLTRTASLVGSLIMPPWLPNRSVKIAIASVADPKFNRNERVRDDRGKKLIRARSMRPGMYDVSIRVTGFPDPILRVAGVQIEPGQRDTHPQLSQLDLASFLFRYQITAVDQMGRPIPGPSGPLLAQIVDQDGKTRFTGFPWKGNKIEVFSTSPQMEVFQMHTGYRMQRSFVSPGVSQLQFFKLPPVRVEMPGVRTLLGTEPTVRVSMVLTKDTGLPTSLRVEDQRTGRGKSYSRAQLSKSSGAWLAKTDSVEVPLAQEGEYQVVLRIRVEGVQLSLPIGKVKVEFPPGVQPTVRVPVDPKKTTAWIDQVRKLRADRAAEKAKAVPQPPQTRGNNTRDEGSRGRNGRGRGRGRGGNRRR